MRTCMQLVDYEDYIDPMSIYSLLALSAIRYPKLIIHLTEKRIDFLFVSSVTAFNGQRARERRLVGCLVVFCNLHAGRKQVISKL